VRDISHGELFDVPEIGPRLKIFGRGRPLQKGNGKTNPHLSRQAQPRRKLDIVRRPLEVKASRRSTTTCPIGGARGRGHRLSKRSDQAPVITG
jgi:hypothetical protein